MKGYCLACDVRWANDGPYCRACSRRLEPWRHPPTPPDGHRSPVHAVTGLEARREADAATCQRRLPAPVGPVRQAVYENITFDVMWDGTEGPC